MSVNLSIGVGNRNFYASLRFSLLSDFKLKWVYRILDNLPVAVLRPRRDGIQSTSYEHGFRVGFKGNYAGVSCELVVDQLLCCACVLL